MRFHKPATALTALATIMLLGQTHAGPGAYGICQIGCFAVQVACYAAAGAIFGTVAAAAVPPAIIACNTAYGTC